MTVQLSFDSGSLLVRLTDEIDPLQLPAGLVYDKRVGCHRAEALLYRDVVRVLHRQGVAYEDTARAYEICSLELCEQREPYPFQTDAISAWNKAGRRGVVVLPTGAGKTFVAVMAIERAQRSCIVLVPTLDLMTQWYDTLTSAFQTDVGLLGGGYHEVKSLTVATYDSGYLHMETLGNRFGLIVADECHHLPSPSHAYCARACIAPFRLGLTATPERSDGAHTLLEELVGPIIIRCDVDELKGTYLSDYEVVRTWVKLSPQEQARYKQARGIYLQFLREKSIRLSGPKGWGQFVSLSSRSPAGRRAFKAWQEQKRIALATPAKLKVLEALLSRHRDERVLIFTYDNDTVYRVSRDLLVPAITHQTPVKERREILQRFAAGTYRAVITSRVLNEGVDVPEASIAVVLSGTASAREHVQRLGRVLRKLPGKRAVLYELITRGTVEEGVSERRRAPTTGFDSGI